MGVGKEWRVGQAEGVTARASRAPQSDWNQRHKTRATLFTVDVLIYQFTKSISNTKIHKRITPF